MWCPALHVDQDGKGIVMESSNPPKHTYLENARGLITHVGRVKSAFTISSLGYCAMHWLIFHGFSGYVLASAIAFGGMAAIAVASLSYWFSSS
jgi:hypothetical protein